MGQNFSRRFFLAGLGAGAGSMALGDAPLVSVRPMPRPAGFERIAVPGVEALLAEARLGSADIGFVVADAHSGRVLEAYNPNTAQPPASVAKVPTALYGLNRLGAGYRFRTQLIATGPVNGGRLQGDLVLVGGGDPTLDTDALGDMARNLRDAGIHEVTGEFKIYAGTLPYVHHIDDSQPDHVGYNPSISGLNLNYNRVYFEWKPADGDYQVTMDARAQRFRPQITVSRMEVVNRDMPVYTYHGRQNRDDWTVARSALGNGGGRWLPVRRPDLYTAEVFQVLARSYGIPLRSATLVNQIPGGAVVVEHTSASLRDILRGMLRYSTNLTAEAIGLSATVAGGSRPANLRASARQMQGWLRQAYGVNDARFVDHSGLGDASRITTQDMVNMLVRVGPGGALRPIMKPYDLEDQPLDVRAKTGTLNFVSALAGYLRTQGGRDLAFVVFASDIPRRNALSLAQRERPQGGRAWTRRARNLQFQLVERWGQMFDA